MNNTIVFWHFNKKTALDSAIISQNTAHHISCIISIICTFNVEHHFLAAGFKLACKDIHTQNHKKNTHKTRFHLTKSMHSITIHDRHVIATTIDGKCSVYQAATTLKKTSTTLRVPKSQKIY